jgi:hypothetical protein
MSNATHWIEVLDQSQSTSLYAKPTKAAIRRMENAAVGVVEEFGVYVYIFSDGSSVYEKRRGDWYPGGKYVQCPECEEWRALEDEEHYFSDICAECDAVGEVSQ